MLGFLLRGIYNHNISIIQLLLRGAVPKVELSRHARLVQLRDVLRDASENNFSEDEIQISQVDVHIYVGV